MEQEVKRLVTYRDLETENIDLDALRDALRAKRRASANTLRAESTDHVVIDIKTKKRHVA